jgi:hypothetical protein
MHRFGASTLSLALLGVATACVDPAGMIVGVDVPGRPKLPDVPFTLGGQDPNALGYDVIVTVWVAQPTHVDIPPARLIITSETSTPSTIRVTLRPAGGGPGYEALAPLSARGTFESPSVQVTSPRALPNNNFETPVGTLQFDLVEGGPFEGHFVLTAPFVAHFEIADGTPAPPSPEVSFNYINKR